MNSKADIVFFLLHAHVYHGEITSPREKNTKTWDTVLYILLDC